MQFETQSAAKFRRGYNIAVIVSLVLVLLAGLIGFLMEVVGYRVGQPGIFNVGVKVLGWTVVGGLAFIFLLSQIRSLSLAYFFARRMFMPGRRTTGLIMLIAFAVLVTGTILYGFLSHYLPLPVDSNALLLLNTVLGGSIILPWYVASQWRRRH